MSVGKLIVTVMVVGGLAYGGKIAYGKIAPGLEASHRAQEKAEMRTGQAVYARAKVRDAEMETAEAVRQRTDKNAQLKEHPNWATPEELQNLRSFGHYWGPDSAESATYAGRYTRADAAEQALDIVTGSRPSEGTEAKTYNHRIRAAYESFASAQRAAYGPGWRAQWESRHGYARSAPSISGLMLPES